jgi:Uri superfamily endonuclease
VERRHRKEKRLLLHIDYLLNNEATKVTAVLYATGKKPEECGVARIIESNAALPFRGFGCPDCDFDNHLFYAKLLIFLMRECNFSK